MASAVGPQPRPVVPPSLNVADTSKRATAGLMMGLITGSMAGVVEVSNALPKNYTVSRLLHDAPMQSMAVSKLSRSAMAVGIGSTLYQLSRSVLLPQPMSEEAKVAASVGVLSPLLALKDFRMRLPWVLVLVGLDYYNGGLGGAGRQRA